MTDARTDILARIRRANAAVSAHPPDVPRGYRRDATVHAAALLDLLEERLVDYRASVTRVAPEALAGQVAALLHAGGHHRIAVPPGLDIDLSGPFDVPDGSPAAAFDVLPDDRSPAAAFDVLPDDGSLTAADLDAVDAVVTRCAVAVAETGTLILDAGPGQGRRALTLVPDVHLCVVEASQVVHTVPEAIARLVPTRPLTWISGPSATSDIELQRVEGVHGPRTLHVLLVT